MSEYAVTLSSQTYQTIARMAQATQQTMDEVISNLVAQPTVYIEARPGVQGGEACIRGTRIPVWVLAALHKQGDTAEDIMEAYPNLSAAQVHAALSYYYEHRAEVDAVIAAQNVHHDQLEGGMDG
jgi:uncharacterized protein (DUF433 family)